MKKTTLILAGLTTLTAITSGSALAATQAAVPTPQDAGIGLSFNGSFSGVGKTPFKTGTTRYNEISSSTFAFGLSQFIPFGQDSGVEASLNYSSTSLKFEPGNNRTLPIPKRLQSLGLGFNYEQPINDRWSAMLGTTLSSASAGSGGFKSKGFGVDVFAAATYKSSPTLSFIGGLAYSSLAEDTTQLFPVLGVSWTPAPQWTVAVGIPETGVTYRFSDSLSLGLVAAFEGGAYYVEADPLPVSISKPNLARTTLDYFAVGVALKAGWQASRRFGVTTSVGTILQREFNYESRKLKLKSDGNGLYYEFGANFAF
jgi:hypothetical protein